MGDFDDNPVYQELIGAIPEDLHEAVTPILQKWDSGYQDRLKEYEPWKPVISLAGDPAKVNMALNLLDVAETDPSKVIDALVDYHKLDYSRTSARKPDTSENIDETPNPLEPRLNFIEQATRQMAQLLIDQKNKDDQAAADAKLDSELAGLRKKYGEFDDTWVISRMHFNGKTSEEAVKEYQKWLEGQVSAYKPKPLFLGSNNGGIPGQRTDVRKMTNTQARDTALQMLMAAKAERER